MSHSRKRCANPSCGEYFQPSRYNPSQEYCEKAECKRCRDNIRQKRRYRKKIVDEQWRETLMARKKKESAARGEAGAPCSEASPLLALSEIQSLLPGMIALFTGSRTHAEVERITEKCRRFGDELQLKSPPIEKNQRFPHAGFEAEKQYSSR